MQFQYCPCCGTKATQRVIGDEGLMPYCETCHTPLFDMFPTCVIVLVVNEHGEAALLRQSYISDTYCNLVSGYMKPGETAESAAMREVQEEIGISVRHLHVCGTYWFAKKELLMIGCIAEADKADFTLSGEVDSAMWVPAEQALSMVHPKGSTSYAVLETYLAQKKPR